MGTSTTFRMRRAGPIEPSVYCDRTVFGVVHVLKEYQDMRRPPRQEMSVAAHDILSGLAKMIFEGREGMVTKDQNGRPWVTLGDQSLAASISHSRNVVAVALATRPDLTVGIDIEYIDLQRPIAELAAQIDMSASIDVHGFYEGWCQYEALFKATGVLDPDQQKHLSPLAEILLDVPADFTGKLVVCSG